MSISEIPRSRGSKQILNNLNDNNNKNNSNNNNNISLVLLGAGDDGGDESPGSGSPEDVEEAGAQTQVDLPAHCCCEFGGEAADRRRREYHVVEEHELEAAQPLDAPEVAQ